MHWIIHLSRITIATKSLIPPESGWHHKGSLTRCTNPAKGSFPRVGIATNHLVLQSQDCNTNSYSSRVRFASKGSLASSRNPAKGSFSSWLTGWLDDCLAPESSLQQKVPWPNFRNPAKGSFPRWLAGWLDGRVRIATKRIFGQIQDSSKGFGFQSRDCNK